MTTQIHKISLVRRALLNQRHLAVADEKNLFVTIDLLCVSERILKMGQYLAKTVTYLVYLIGPPVYHVQSNGRNTVRLALCNVVLSAKAMSGKRHKSF